MRRANDQIFQLSLTEIAFTLAFILLLLLGYMFMQADDRAKQLEEALLESGTLATNTEILEKARAELATELIQAGVKPDDVISSLLSQSKLVQERDILKKRVDDLDKQLSALTEVKNTLNAAHGSTGTSNALQKEITDALALKEKLEKQLKQEGTAAPAAEPTLASSPSAASNAPAFGSAGSALATAQKPRRPDVTAEALSGLALKGQIRKQLREQLDEPYPVGQEPVLAHDLVVAKKQLQAFVGKAGNVATIIKENADLRGQLAFLKKLFDQRGGRDYPPCWADEQTGKVQFLFTIEIAPDGLHITPAWPEKRQTDASALPDIDRLTAGEPLSLSGFSATMLGIDRVSKSKECRHYVYIKNRVTDLKMFNTYRYGIENFFYKLELRG